MYTQIIEFLNHPWVITVVSLIAAPTGQVAYRRYASWRAARFPQAAMKRLKRLDANSRAIAARYRSPSSAIGYMAEFIVMSLMTWGYHISMAPAHSTDAASGEMIGSGLTLLFAVVTSYLTMYAARELANPARALRRNLNAMKKIMAAAESHRVELSEAHLGQIIAIVATQEKLADQLLREMGIDPDTLKADNI